jgi:DNA-binding PadR family transcriptional regulator
MEERMNYNKLLPLTETTFYIMLSLVEPSHGYAIMQNVEQLSHNKVKVAAGTLYGAIENLLKQKLIVEVKDEDKRRRVYTLTPEGNELLKLEIERLKHLISISKDLVTGGN